MMSKTQLVLLLCSVLCWSASAEEARKFPDGFVFGCGTASYQVEGAWDEDGKAENIWDRMTHTDPCATLDCGNGDIASDSYHNVERDVEMMRELGLDYYRFSISWPRILPTSFPDYINPAGVDYYNRLINEMLKYNIQPYITLFHWDLPQKLQEMGGWTNPMITDWYADFARVAFELFGDRVKYWITFNEPREVCYQGYGNTLKAPRLNISGLAEYHCAKNLLVAHGKAYKIYDEEFRATQGGVVGLTLSVQWLEPETEKDTEAAEELLQFDMGIYANPIFSEQGNFPQIVIDKIAQKSAQQGYPRSRLPEFNAEEIEMIRGSADYFGLNHYTTYLVYRNETVNSMYAVPSYYDDSETGSYQDPSWNRGTIPWGAEVPWGFYKLLTRIRTDYNNPPLYIIENGFSSTGLNLDDDARIDFIRHYLDVMLDAIDEGSDIRGYTCWTLMDNFEWMWGYVHRFGLYEIDFEDPLRVRTPRRSAFAYKQILRTRELDMSWYPEPDAVMTIDEGH